MMAFLAAQSCVPQQLRIVINGPDRHWRGIFKPHSHARVSVRVAGGRHRVEAFFNSPDDPIVQKALKEPIAFFGGVFAGLLRLDLKEDPLREWVARTAEAAGLDVDQDPEPKSEEVTHDSCGEKSNILDDQLALDDEWLSVAGSSTLNKDVIRWTIDVDHGSFFSSPSSFWTLLLNRVMCDLGAIFGVFNYVPLEASCCCCYIKSCRFIVTEH